MLGEIDSAMDSMTRAERKVAEAVLRSPYRLLRKSIGALAAEAGVSEPTVIRFCRTLKCRGFQDFKLQLAQDLATGAQQMFQHFAQTTPGRHQIGTDPRGAMQGLGSPPTLDPSVIARTQDLRHVVPEVLLVDEIGGVHGASP